MLSFTAFYYTTDDVSDINCWQKFKKKIFQFLCLKKISYKLTKYTAPK